MTETTWIAMGLSEDLPPGVAMAGRWRGEELAVWRSASGKLSAWRDRCPHRGMRLSHGFVRGETLACIYHGWVYGADGACRHIPAHPDLTPPATIRAQAFQCREGSGLIWVALEGQGKAPPALDGMVALRSLSLTCSEVGVLAVEPGLKRGEGGLLGSVMIAGQAIEVALMVQEGPEGVTLHALIAKGADLTLASRWLEDLRRRAEVGRGA